MVDSRSKKPLLPARIFGALRRSPPLKPTLTDDIDQTRAVGALKRRRAIVLLRLALAIGAAYLLIGQGGAFELASPTVWLIAAALLSNLAFIWMPPDVVTSKRFTMYLVVADTIWIAAALLASRELNQDFYLVFFLAVFVVAIAENLPLMAIGVAVVCGGYLYSVYATEGLEVAISAATLIRLPFFAAAAALYGYLADSFRRERQQSLMRMAHRDSLTDLPNRRELHERLEQAISRGYQTGGWVALLLWDIDRRLPVFIDNVTADNAELRGTLSDASPESEIGINTRIRGNEEILDEAVRFYITHIEHMDQLELGSSRARASAAEALESRAGNLAARLELVKQRLDESGELEGSGAEGENFARKAQ